MPSSLHLNHHHTVTPEMLVRVCAGFMCYWVCFIPLFVYMCICVCVFSGASGEMGCGGGGHVAGFVGVGGVQGEVCGPGHPGLAAGSAPETRPEGTAGQRALRQRLLLQHLYTHTQITGCVSNPVA